MTEHIDVYKPLDDGDIASIGLEKALKRSIENKNVKEFVALLPLFDNRTDRHNDKEPWAAIFLRKQVSFLKNVLDAAAKEQVNPVNFRVVADAWNLSKGYLGTNMQKAMERILFNAEQQSYRPKTICSHNGKNIDAQSRVRDS